MAPLPSPPPGAPPSPSSNLGFITLNNQITDNEIVTACARRPLAPRAKVVMHGANAGFRTVAQVTTSSLCRLYLCVGGGALIFLLFLCFLKPVKLYQTRQVSPDAACCQHFICHGVSATPVRARLT